MPLSWRTRRTHLFAAALLLATAACRAPAVAPPPAELQSLEDIFFLPGPQGRAPAVESLAADGLWAFVRWSPLVTRPDGARALDRARSLWLVRTDRAAAAEGVGEPASELWRRIAANELSGDAEDQLDGDDELRVPKKAWSRRGHRFALAQGGEIWIADASASAASAADWRVRRLYADPPKEDGEARLRLERVISLRFETSDAELWVDNGEETYAFALASDLETMTEQTLEAARCLTAELPEATADVEFARDHSVAFSWRGAFEFRTSEFAPDDAHAGAKRKGQILFLDDRRTVELDGFPAVENPEHASLSPDGRYVVAEAVERADEPPHQLVPNYLTTRVSTREARRERADDLECERELRAWSTADGSARVLELGPGATRNVAHLGWSRDPAHGALYAFTRTSEDWRTFEVWRWTEAGPALVFRDHDDGWYGGPCAGARWSGDGARLIVGSESTPRSSTPGRCQLFSLDPATGVLRQLTSVRGEVDAFDLARDGSLAYLASDGDPRRRVLGYCNGALVRGEAGARAFLVSAPQGYLSSLSISDDGRRALFRRHTLGNPAELWSVELREDARPVQVSRTAPRAFVEPPRILPQVFTTRARDGSPLWSHVYLPRATSLDRPDRRRPAVVFLHGAGYLQNVTDSLTEYEPNVAFHSRLAEQGYVVVDVDFRGSAGYGRRFRVDVRERLGELELADVHAVLDALAQRGVVDARRVACYGGSYGGFLTLMALFTEPGRWRAGAALRPVTDWRSYHPSYTQPRLGRPSTDEAAYARSSPIDHAEGLSDPLLVLHGMQDSNVFVQDSIRLIERLIDLGKDFDAMLYPSQEHAFADGRHWVDEYRRIERLMRQHLGEP